MEDVKFSAIKNEDPDIATIITYVNDVIIEYREVPTVDIKRVLLGNDKYNPIEVYRDVTAKSDKREPIASKDNCCDRKTCFRINQEKRQRYRAKEPLCHFCSRPYPCFENHKHLTLMFNCHIDNCRFSGSRFFNIYKHTMLNHRGHRYENYVCACHLKEYRNGKENLACKIRQRTYRRR